MLRRQLPSRLVTGIVSNAPPASLRGSEGGPSESWPLAMVAGAGASVLSVILAWWPLFVARAPFNRGSASRDLLDGIVFHAIALGVGVAAAHGARIGIGRERRTLVWRCVRLGAKSGAVVGVFMPVLLAVLRADPDAPTYSISMLIVGAPVGAVIGSLGGVAASSLSVPWLRLAGFERVGTLPHIGVWLVCVAGAAGLLRLLTQYPFKAVPVLVGIGGLGCIAAAAIQYVSKSIWK